MNIKREVAIASAIHNMEPAYGDLLPAIGERVMIYLATPGKWVGHNVIGYYVWGDLGGSESLFRVNIRVVDDEGIENARALQDIIRGNVSSQV